MKNSEREINESTPFTIATKRIKYLGMNLTKETNELCTDNYKTLMKETKDDMNHILVYLNETRSCRMGPPKIHGSWWRGLKKCSPLEKGMANHFSILALRTP